MITFPTARLMNEGLGSGIGFFFWISGNVRVLQSYGFVFVLSSQAKPAHEFVWYYIRDPNQFDLKPPRRWDPAGLKKQPPRPFYNREDGHFLLNNTCTITNLFLLPELRRLQCYFLPKLPKIRADRNFYLPIKKVFIFFSFSLFHLQISRRLGLDLKGIKFRYSGENSKEFLTSWPILI